MMQCAEPTEGVEFARGFRLVNSVVLVRGCARNFPVTPPVGAVVGRLEAIHWVHPKKKTGRLPVC